MERWTGRTESLRVPIKKKVQRKEGGKPQTQKVKDIRKMFENGHIEKYANRIEVGKEKKLAEKFDTVKVEQSRQIIRKRKLEMNELWDTVLQKEESVLKSENVNLGSTEKGGRGKM